MIRKMVKNAVACVLASLTVAVTIPAFGEVTDGGSPGGRPPTGANTNGETSPGGPGCYDSGMIGTKMITNICWDCVFPIIVSKVPISSDGQGRIPPGAASTSFLGTCMCHDNNGVPSFGVRTSLWEPARIIELQRQSGCSGVLGGVRFPFNRLNQGTQQSLSQSPTTGSDGKTYRHYHFYSYPLMLMLDMWIPSKCNPGGYVDLDIMYMSEIDPTWNNDEIAFFTHPEAALIASPLGPIACLPDVFGANIGKPIKELYWCAGSWGVIYPTSGNVLSKEGIMRSTSLMGTRALYALHRRGLEWRSIGSDCLCGGKMSPFLPKNQYRFQTFHPVAETSENHVIGQMTLSWALGRTIPAVGEDPSFVIWRWLDCCNTNS